MLISVDIDRTCVYVCVCMYAPGMKLSFCFQFKQDKMFLNTQLKLGRTIFYSWAVNWKPSAKLYYKNWVNKTSWITLTCCYCMHKSGIFIRHIKIILFQYGKTTAIAVDILLFSWVSQVIAILIIIKSPYHCTLIQRIFSVHVNSIFNDMKQKFNIRKYLLMCNNNVWTNFNFLWKYKLYSLVF